MLTLGLGICSNAQGVAINTDGSSADASAILDVQGSNEGFLLPRMTTTERDAISSPANGLFIFNTDSLGLEVYTTRGWQGFEKVSCAAEKPSEISGPAQVNSGSTHTYTITAVNGANSYHWTVPVGAVIQSGQNTTSIVVKFSMVSGDICVCSQNTCGNSDYNCFPVIVVF